MLMQLNTILITIKSIEYIVYLGIRLFKQILDSYAVDSNMGGV